MAHDAIPAEVRRQAALEEASRLARAFREHMVKHGLVGEIVGGVYAINDATMRQYAQGSLRAALTQEDVARVLRSLPDHLAREVSVP